MACKECGGNGGHHKPGCGMSPAALQINNKDCALFHSVTIPAIMGDETENPPANGLYKNVLLYYEASGNAYFYSSDGIPTKLTYATTDYNALTNKPTINGVTLEGNQSSSSLGININDATLTIKQGDTTLGTFSANASENVEVDIPTGADKIHVTLDYGDTDDWYSGDGDKGLDFGWDEQQGYGDKITGAIVYRPTFTDEANNRTYTGDEMIELLKAGTEIVLDNVPLGFHYSPSGGYDFEPVNGLTFSANYVDGATIYTGTASLILPISSADRFAPLCFMLAGSEPKDNPGQDEDPMFPPYFLFQGVYHMRPPA